MTKDSVTVIIPTHNRWPIVCDAIDSVLAQTHGGVECIVVDDASTDNTPLLLKEKYGDKITVLCNEINCEKSYSRNKGIEAARSKYICFLDSDDILVPDSIASRLEVYVQQPDFTGVSFGLCRPKTISTKEEQRLFQYLQDHAPLSLSAYIHNKKTMCTNSFMLPRKAMLEYGMYNEQLTNREDIELFVRLFCHMEFRFCGGHVGYVRPIADNRARNQWAKVIEQQQLFSEQLLRNTDVVVQLGDDIDTIMAEEQREILTSLYRSKKYSEFVRCYKMLSPRDKQASGSRYRKRYLISCVLQYFEGFDAISGDDSIDDSVDYKAYEAKEINGMVLKDSCLDEVITFDSLRRFLSGADVLKTEKNRRILVGRYQGGEKIFCKIYLEYGLLPAIRRFLLGSRARNAHCRTAIFKSIGQQTPDSIGYLLVKKSLINYECFHFTRFIEDASTLVDMFNENGNLDAKQKESILVGLGDSLSAMHSANYVHGDVKLNNIVYAQGQVYFVDLDGFGRKGIRKSPMRDVARLMVGLSEVGVDKQSVAVFSKSYCEGISLTIEELQRKVAPFVNAFQDRHRKKYGRAAADVF